MDDVESVTTGVKNVNLVMENLKNVKPDKDPNTYIAPDAEIYTLYNDDGYVIGRCHHRRERGHLLQLRLCHQQQREPRGLRR